MLVIHRNPLAEAITDRIAYPLVEPVAGTLGKPVSEPVTDRIADSLVDPIAAPVADRICWSWHNQRNMYNI